MVDRLHSRFPLTGFYTRLIVLSTIVTDFRIIHTPGTPLVVCSLYLSLLFRDGLRMVLIRWFSTHNDHHLAHPTPPPPARLNLDQRKREDNKKIMGEFPPATHHHYRGVVLPQRCSIETIEGRKYEATLDMVNNCPTLTDGWRDFVLAEDIALFYFLVFRPGTIFDFEVLVMEPNGCERLPHYTFSLEIKPTHVERARKYLNYNSAMLKFGDIWYDVDIIHGHGKKLLQNGRARQFIDNNDIVVGDVCTFFLLPHDEVIKFKVKM
ncbi:B3 domain-containing protein [Striga asiatica]|uniref:B3 domain-containing protein n=1 Tax=Striga asiatica TaxID=4170 RepID=A0A5A7Q3V2_STRAF|nr:B3 domain-containing protein [Striga asiatica]